MHIIKCGGCSLTKSRGRILEEILIERDMVILNTGQATRITSNQSSNISVIDLVFVLEI